MNRPNWFFWFLLILVGIVPLLARASLNEDEFREVNQTLIEMHAPQVEKKGRIKLSEHFQVILGHFRIAGVAKPLTKNRFIITLTGTIPQSAAVSIDGYAITVCHELGHILGGRPRQNLGILRWSSTEGQADYYATNECMWNYVMSTRTSDVIHQFDAEGSARCDAKFGKDTKKMLGCLRIMSGIKSLMDYFNTNFKPKPKEPISLKKRDLQEVTATLDKYPSPQCRVDTWIAGLFGEPRPRCWYNG